MGNFLTIYICVQSSLLLQYQLHVEVTENICLEHLHLLIFKHGWPVLLKWEYSDNISSRMTPAVEFLLHFQGLACTVCISPTAMRWNDNPTTFFTVICAQWWYLAWQPLLWKRMIFFKYIFMIPMVYPSHDLWIASSSAAQTVSRTHTLSLSHTHKALIWITCAALEHCSQ